MGPTSTLPEDAFLANTLPENSLAAIKQALELGADGVEIDVHLTKDGRIAVIHDDNLNKKVYKANRIGADLGLVSEHTLEELMQYDIGHGHRIPSLRDVLELIIAENGERRSRGEPSLIINIELKGRDVVNATYLEISDYINKGRLSADDFIFNSFDWKKLEEIKGFEPRFKVVPAIRTVDLFGIDNVEMPHFKVAENCPYQPHALEALQDLHNRIGCYAFDCIVFDLRPGFIDFCEKNEIGLLTSTSKDAVKADSVKSRLALMIKAAGRLPMVCFRADNTTETLDILSDLRAERESIPHLASRGSKVPKTNFGLSDPRM